MKRDEITNVSAEVQTNSYNVIMKWNRPQNPNGGYILAYEIRIIRYDDETRYMKGLKYDKA